MPAAAVPILWSLPLPFRRPRRPIDPLPPGVFDFVVMLGVLEYLHAPEAALAKIFVARQRVLSYCAVRGAKAEIVAIRRERGWLNDFSRADLVEAAERRGWRLRKELPFNEASDFVQSIFLFESASRGCARGTSDGAGPREEP